VSAEQPARTVTYRKDGRRKRRTMMLHADG
jgi:hypothetical protein